MITDWFWGELDEEPDVQGPAAPESGPDLPESGPDIWDQIVGIPMDRWHGARTVNELRHYIELRDEGRIHEIEADAPAAWSRDPGVLSRAIAALAESA